MPIRRLKQSPSTNLSLFCVTVESNLYPGWSIDKACAYLL